MSQESTHHRRHFLRNAAMTITAAELGMIGVAGAQFNKEPAGPKGAQRMSQPEVAQFVSAPQTVRPFRANVSDAALTDLRRRIAATRWPSRELVTDRSQGVQLATLREL